MRTVKRLPLRALWIGEKHLRVPCIRHLLGASRKRASATIFERKGWRTWCGRVVMWLLGVARRETRQVVLSKPSQKRNKRNSSRNGNSSDLPSFNRIITDCVVKLSIMFKNWWLNSRNVVSVASCIIVYRGSHCSKCAASPLR